MPNDQIRADKPMHHSASECITIHKNHGISLAHINIRTPAQNEPSHPRLLERLQLFLADQHARARAVLDLHPPPRAADVLVQLIKTILNLINRYETEILFVGHNAYSRDIADVFPDERMSQNLRRPRN